MLGNPLGKQGSKLPMFAAYRRTISPPYCGLPRLSHQLPVAAVVVGVVVGAVVVAVVGGAVLVVVVVVVMGVVVDVVADVAHDAKTSDITIRQVNTIQIALLFIWTSFYF
jgi:hypothetical protein